MGRCGRRALGSAPIFEGRTAALRLDSGSGLLAALEQDELDAILTREVSSEFLESRRLFPMHVLAVLGKGHRLASRRAVAVEQLQDEGVLLDPKPFTSRMLFDAACRTADLRPRIVLESPYQGALLALAEGGHGVAILPSTMSLAGRSVIASALGDGEVPIGTWTALVWDRRHWWTRSSRSRPPRCAATTRAPSCAYLR